MRDLMPVVVAVLCFALSFFVKRPRLRPFMAVVCAALAVFFIATVFIDGGRGFASFFFAALSMYLTVRYVRKPKSIEDFDERT